ncbi:hypothetical protein V6R21_25860 [Limibacter armeniacum]|uniref:hypothetical protein n=1 Tax=Limibacter armeniacum TaxID=466084 RepID=UPI002FE62600
MKKFFATVLMTAFVLGGNVVLAQEYDDMYFFKSDREALAHNASPAMKPSKLQKPAYQSNETNQSKYSNPDISGESGNADYSYYEETTPTGNSVYPTDAMAQSAYNYRNNPWRPNMSMSMGYGFGGPSYGVGANWSPFWGNSMMWSLGLSYGFGSAWGGYPGYYGMPYSYGMGGFYDPYDPFYNPYDPFNRYGYGYAYNPWYNPWRNSGVVVENVNVRTGERPTQNGYVNAASANVKLPNRFRQQETYNYSNGNNTNARTRQYNGNSQNYNNRNSSPWRNSNSFSSPASNSRVSSPASSGTRSSSNMRSYRRR